MEMHEADANSVPDSNGYDDSDLPRGTSQHFY